MEGPTSFAAARFARLSLREARFGGPVQFAGSVFEGPVDLSGAVFAGDTTFEHTTFREAPTLDGSQFGGRLSTKGLQGPGAEAFRRAAR